MAAALKAFLGSLLLVVGLALFVRIFGTIKPLSGQSVSIAITHKDPADVQLEWSKKDLSGVLQIQNDSNEELGIHLPVDWVRGEVRGTSIESITRGDTGLGSTRWNIPPGANVRFTFLPYPQHVTILNPNGVILKVHAVMTDVVSKIYETQLHLVQTEPLKLW